MTTPEAEFKRIADKWMETIEVALTRVENHRRLMVPAEPFPENTPVWILPRKIPHAPLLLLNWKVWMKRYCVSLEFILETLTRVYRNHRRCKSTEIRLGLPISMITGPAARLIIEEEVKRIYPNGENFTFAAQAPPLLPPKFLAYQTADEMAQKYSSIMEKRHKQLATKENHYRRNFRKANTANFKR